jgi:phosphoribosylaminoimidazole (AIR) synthetase
MPSVMTLLGALGGLEPPELRATFNGGLGMLLVVPPEGLGTVEAVAPDALIVGEVVAASSLGSRYVETPG